MDKEQLQRAKDKVIRVASECQNTLQEVARRLQGIAVVRSQTPDVRQEDEIGGFVLVSDVRVQCEADDLLVILGAL